MHRAGNCRTAAWSLTVAIAPGLSAQPKLLQGCPDGFAHLARDLLQIGHRVPETRQPGFAVTRVESCAARMMRWISAGSSSRKAGGVDIAFLLFAKLARASDATDDCDSYQQHGLGDRLMQQCRGQGQAEEWL